MSSRALVLEPDLTRIREVRKRLGWTQKRLALLPRVTGSTISRWERVCQRPSQAHRTRLALFLSADRGPKREPLVPPQIASPPQFKEARPSSLAQPSGAGLALIPVSLRQAGKYIAENHRHHRPPTGAKFAMRLAFAWTTPALAAGAGPVPSEPGQIRTRLRPSSAGWGPDLTGSAVRTTGREAC